ncbi:Alpha-1,3-mannosyltransferase CMT1 [Smittium culicis]|uniref:Alpha-1,3-mannosyltransferase CMT1 n=1 Tax=Smittium culicis TaxID=133412 RepID=A0A1R1XSF9_9FUNG|nr:Alpha-1,3-mannosyltransferase CMT1 [Smittium culicis]
MGVSHKLFECKRKYFSRLFIFAFITFAFLIISNIRNDDTKIPITKKKINDIKLSSVYFCKTDSRKKFDRDLEGNGTYDYLRFDSSEYGPGSDDILLTDQIRFKAGKIQNYLKNKKKIFFAINIFNNEDIIPYIIQEIALLIRFLGPENVFLSIYENGSNDKSKELLHEFNSFMDSLDVRFSIKTDDLQRPANYHKVQYLAEIKNRALIPLEEEHKKGYKYDKIVFFNDVVFCKNDILELIYQSDLQKSDITSPLDIHSAGNSNHLNFTNSWTARDLDGNEINGNISNLIKHKQSAERYNQGLPTQVQCSLNGVSVLNAAPFYGNDPIRFRKSKFNTTECSASEYSLMCNDFWSKGFRRIVIVPNILVTHKKENIPLIDNNYQTFINKNVTLPELIPYVDGPELIQCRALVNNNTDAPGNILQWVKYTNDDTKVM